MQLIDSYCFIQANNNWHPMEHVLYNWLVGVGCVCTSMFHCWYCGHSDLAWELWGSPGGYKL